MSDGPFPPAEAGAGLAATLPIGSARRPGRRLRGAVAQYLGAAIVSGRIPPGEVLSGEIANSAALDVSRSAYREAVQVLTAKGLVESRPKAGTRVLPRSRWAILDPMVLAWAFSAEPDLALIRDLFELRAAVEPAAARCAAARRDRHDIDALRGALARMKRHTLATDAGRLADRQFHEALLRATHNDVMIALSASISAVVGWTTELKQRSRVLPRDPAPDHARVCEAIVAGDVEAADAAMRTLVNLALEDTRLAL